MSNYDKIINMLCITGKMPVNLMDAVCEEAHRQINCALNLAQNIRSKQEERERLIFSERAKDIKNYKSEWLDYEAENICNFSI